MPKKGYQPSEAARRKMSESAKRKRLSPEHRARIAAAMTGKTQSPSTKEKRARSLSAESRARISAATAERNKTRVWSDESRESAAVRATYRLKKKVGTRLELEVASRLADFDFLTQAKIEGDSRHLWDFVLPRERVLIEADGCYWHGCAVCGKRGTPANRKADVSKNEVAARLGWRLVRVRECQVQSFSLSV